MAISFRNAASTNQANAATIVISKPSGVVAGDVMYASLYDAGGNSHSTLAGWTEVAFQIDGTGNSVTVLRRVADGTEGSSFTFNNVDSGLVNGSISAYVGVNNTTPEDATATTSNGSTQAVIAPTITTVTDNAWWVAIFETDATQSSLSLPSGFTNDVPTFGASGDFQRVDHKLISPAGATGTATSNADVAGGWITVSLALRPAAVSPSGRRALAIKISPSLLMQLRGPGALLLQRLVLEPEILRRYTQQPAAAATQAPAPELRVILQAVNRGGNY